MLKVAKIQIIGLKRTKEYVVKKNLPFKSGDEISKSQLKQISENAEELLKNSFLFNSVQVKLMPVRGYVDILVNVSERWYIWPLPVLDYADPNFNTFVKSGDWSRTNYGVDITDLNFRGRAEKLGLKIQFGYSRDFELVYDSPYFSEKKNFGLGAKLGFIQRNEITVFTENDERFFYLGEEGKSREIKEGEFYVSHNWQNRISQHFFASVSSVNVEDSILKLAPNYLLTNTNQLNYAKLGYSLKVDYRDSKVYPLNGLYFDVSLAQNGLGFFKENTTNTFVGRATIKGFKNITKKFNIASSVTGKYYSKTLVPYYLQEGLGYYYNLRGYEFYVIDGQQFALFKSNLKYQLIAPRKKTLFKNQQNKFSKFHYAFYLNVFFDAGYVKDDVYLSQNSLSNKLLMSKGVGIDFVTFYDRVFRIEWSSNDLNETGFYVHFVQPI